MTEEKLDASLLKDLVTIYSTEDAKIKEIGKLLVSDTGRQILQLLFSETLTAKQISEKTGFDIPLIKHHVQRMLDLNVVKIAKIEKSEKSQDMKFYTASPHAIIILPSTVTEKAKKSKMLSRSLKMIYKVTSVGIVTVSTWFGTQFIQNPNLEQSPSVDTGDSTGIFSIDPKIPVDPWSVLTSDVSLSFIASLIVAVGMFWLLFYLRR